MKEVHTNGVMETIHSNMAQSKMVPLDCIVKQFLREIYLPGDISSWYITEYHGSWSQELSSIALRLIFCELLQRGILTLGFSDRAVVEYKRGSRGFWEMYETV